MDCIQEESNIGVMGILGSQYPQPIPSASRSRPNTNTSVFLKDLKIPFDVSVSPFIDPG
jgi:hypothetical protein